jgi:translation initiation factor IF-3
MRIAATLLTHVVDYSCDGWYCTVTAISLRVAIKGGVLATSDLKINEQIRVSEVRLIDAEGNQLGVIQIQDAMTLAKESGADLVEIAPNASPPVCKILDYGKYKFEQEKRLKESRRRQKQLRLKEIRMQPKIEKHDLAFKSKHVQEFLDEGNKVKVTIRFRGRELAHTELGKVVLERLVENLDQGSFSVDRGAQMEGRFMSMLLAPKGKK